MKMTIVVLLNTSSREQPNNHQNEYQHNNKMHSVTPTINNRKKTKN